MGGLLIGAAVHRAPVQIPSGIMGQAGCEDAQGHGVAPVKGMKEAQLVVVVGQPVDEIRPVHAGQVPLCG